MMQRNTFIDGNRFEVQPWEKEPITSKYANVKGTSLLCISKFLDWITFVPLQVW